MLSNQEIRIIFHFDLDCFFAAVECVLHPEYKGHPVVVGADPQGGKGRGVVSTASYEARKFGIHSGQPISQAYHACPTAIYVHSNFGAYSDASQKVMQIMRKYTNSFQQGGIDEGYMDMTDMCADFTHAREVARQIQQEVFRKTQLTISIGIAATKSLAKIATDIQKPNGITVLEIEKIPEILGPLDVTKIPGIGKKSKEWYYRAGYRTINDLLHATYSQIRHTFGKWGEWIYFVIRGQDNRPVMEFHDQKSSSEERTFHEDTWDVNQIKERLYQCYRSLHQEMSNREMGYRTITLKIRFKGFETYTRTKSESEEITESYQGKKIIDHFLTEFMPLKKPVRLVGIKLSNFEEEKKILQLSLADFLK